MSISLFKIFSRPFALLFLLLLAWLLASCATDTGNPTRDRMGRLTNATLDQLGSAAIKITSAALLKQAQTGFSSDWSWSLQQGLYENLDSIVSPDAFAKIAAAWNPAAPSVNKQLTNLVQGVAPTTPDEARAVTNTIAQAVVTATAEHTSIVLAK